MVTTRSFELSRKQFFFVILEMTLKTRWWSFLLPIAISVYATFTLGPDTLFFRLFPLVYVFTTCLRVYLYAYSRQNANMISERKLVIYPDKIASQAGGSNVFDTPVTNEVAIDSIWKKVTLNHYWLLYVNRVNYFIVPKDAFTSDADRQAFETMVLNRVKK
ncbi:MAG TPA: YcxB family protein [Flavisolibacter sp.]|jgi:hypothetical protein|nr:YcxB family protein [Flavisolibacter sp.]